MKRKTFRIPSRRSSPTPKDVIAVVRRPKPVDWFMRWERERERLDEELRERMEPGPLNQGEGSTNE